MAASSPSAEVVRALGTLVAALGLVIGAAVFLLGDDRESAFFLALFGVAGLLMRIEAAVLDVREPRNGDSTS
jgi:hypothetical protein